MKAKYLNSLVFSTSTFIWSVYGWYTDMYNMGLLLYALSYFMREVYTCVKRSDYQYIIHGAAASTAIVTALAYGPEYYKYVYNGLSIFEFSTPFLNIAKEYRTALSYQAFASAFFTGRILIGTYMYLTVWMQVMWYTSSCMMVLQYYWLMQICLKARELKAKSE